MAAPSSYHPVAILTALSKILERAVLLQLQQLIDNKMPNCQFGFRSQSTSATITAAHGTWSKARAAGKIVGIAAYDLSAAFDTLDHQILLEKLAIMGISQKSCNWFSSYLSCRTQHVLYKDSLSSALKVRYGHTWALGGG